MPSLTLESALTSSHMINSSLESPAALQMLAAAKSSTDVAEKWQRVNTVLIQATLQAVSTLGFTPDAHGFEGYTRSFAELMRSDEARGPLQQLNEAKWTTLLKHGYGCGVAAPLTLAQARGIAIELVDALQDAELMKQLDESRTGLTSRLSNEERQGMIARILVQEQVKVLARHGFEGAEGFAQAQVCLMAHAADAVVTASVAAATQNLYSRGGIDLVAALRQAAGGAP
eukprot:2703908-Prymnesium_polylepis.1